MPDMYGSLNYQEVMVAIKKWVGENRLTTDSLVEVSGNNAARQATIGEMLMKFATQAFGSAIGGDSLPPGPLKDAVSSIGNQVKDVMGSLGSSLNISDAMGDLGKYFYQNPVEFQNNQYDALINIYSNENIADEIKDSAAQIVLNAKPDGLWNQATELYNDFTNQLSGVTIPGTDGFTFKQALDLGVDKTNEFLSAATGIKKFDVIDLASCIAAPIAMTKFKDYHEQLKAAQGMPELTSLQRLAKNQALNNAANGMSEAAREMTAQVAADKAAYAQALAQRNAISLITNEGELYNIITNDANLTSEHKQLYISTLQASTLENAKRMSDLLDARNPMPTITSVK